MTPSQVTAVLALATKALPVLREITGFSSIRDFVDYMNNMEEQGLLPDDAAIDKIDFPSLDNLVIEQKAPSMPRPKEFFSPFMTYYISSDKEGKLKRAAKSMCSFWNQFVVPKNYVVNQFGLFESADNTIARAYYPFNVGVMTYGRVEFNTKYLDQFDDLDILITCIHEAGHVLGIGWEKWLSMFDHETGFFHDSYIEKVGELAEMQVELDFGPGSELAHWDETYEEELMTPIMNGNEFVLPVTIDVLALLGHRVIKRLLVSTRVSELIEDAAKYQFTKKAIARNLNLDLYRKMPVMEVYKR